MQEVRIQIISEKDQLAFVQFCAEKGIIHDPNSILAIVEREVEEQIYWELKKLDEPKLGSVFVDFTTGTMAHRRKFGGGRGEAVAKAVGVKKGELPTVIDATAGLGRDAFVLASIGCKVRLVERHPVVRLLLQNGLERAYANAEIGNWMRENMQLLEVNHITELNPEIDFADVVYLDPMYPHKNKSALVKKEMRVFQSLVGADLDADTLLAPALKLAKKRVVVKRPDYAEYLAQQKPQFSRETKNHRFDIYSTMI